MAEAGYELGARRVPRAPWIRFSRWAILTTPIAWLLIVANLGSAVPGYLLWYGRAILDAPWYYWPFVPDSPLSVTFMGIAVFAFHYRRRWETLGIVAAGACIKYGLWTDFVWLSDYPAWGHYGYGMMAISMSITHLGMVIEGFILASFLRFRPVPVLIASVFFIVNDLVDYVAGFHPPLPEAADERAIMLFAVLTTALIVAAFIILSWLSSRRSKSGLSWADREGA